MSNTNDADKLYGDGEIPEDADLNAPAAAPAGNDDTGADAAADIVPGAMGPGSIETRLDGKDSSK